MVPPRGGKKRHPKNLKIWTSKTCVFTWVYSLFQLFHVFFEPENVQKAQKPNAFGLFWTLKKGSQKEAQKRTPKRDPKSDQNEAQHGPNMCQKRIQSCQFLLLVIFLSLLFFLILCLSLSFFALALFLFLSLRRRRRRRRLCLSCSLSLFLLLFLLSRSLLPRSW